MNSVQAGPVPTTATQRATSLSPPSAAELKLYSGTYVSEELGRACIEAIDGELMARLEALPMRLLPARSPDLFGAMETTFEGPTPLKFQLDDGGRPSAFTWNECRFQRRRGPA